VGVDRFSPTVVVSGEKSPFSICVISEDNVKKDTMSDSETGKLSVDKKSHRTGLSDSEEQ